METFSVFLEDFSPQYQQSWDLTLVSGGGKSDFWSALAVTVMQTLLWGEESSVGKNLYLPENIESPKRRTVTFSFGNVKRDGDGDWGTSSIWGRFLQWWSTPLCFSSLLWISKLPWQHNTVIAPAHGPNVFSKGGTETKQGALEMLAGPLWCVLYPQGWARGCYGDVRSCYLKEQKSEPASQTEICISEWQAVCS